MSNLADLTDRARLIFQQIVESYLETGNPIGSRSMSDVLEPQLSPASIRSTMAELERAGLLYAPHVSAGRLPTQTGLRLFIDGLLELGELSDVEREAIAPQLNGTGMDDMLTQAIDNLSGLSLCAGLVLAPQAARGIKHIEFTQVSATQILVILVDETNHVENRVIDMPAGIGPAALTEAGNYLNARLKGSSLGELRRDLQQEMARLEAELGSLTAQLVETGLAQWAGDIGNNGGNADLFAKSLLVRGQSHLLDNVAAMEDLERVRLLFEDIDRKQELVALLSQAEESDGVKIFIGAETPLFSLSGSSLIISPYQDSEKHIVGVLGVIAPTRANYARLIPLVDHTARVVTKMLG